jgi:hypothetical protein
MEQHNLVDYELMAKINEHYQSLAEKQRKTSRITNPCVRHQDRSISFICRDDQIGLCGECMVEHYEKEHSVLSLVD